MITIMSPVPPAITPSTYYPSTGSPVDHTEYTMENDYDCAKCHNTSATLDTDITVFMHGTLIGVAGGPNCTSCHDGSGTQKVDVAAMNQSSIHLNLNNVPGFADRDEDRMCWGCHTNDSLYSTGNNVTYDELPPDVHPDRYNNPKNCIECHVDPKFNATLVAEHYTNGSELKTKSYANYNESCISCHNKSEMLMDYADPIGSWYANVSHYGKNRTELRTGVNGSTNCSYCHQNVSTVFPFVDDSDKTIANHTSRITNPSCVNSTCHNEGWIHNATLDKSTVDHDLCQACHAGRYRHNGTLECYECHGNATNRIHPILYLRYDNTTSTSNASAVNCTSCHQSNNVDGSLTLYPPKVPSPTNFDFNHSDNVSAGERWDDYWNKTDDLTACIYCHGKVIHNATALGNSSVIAYNDIVNGTIDTSSYWCSGCHYQYDDDYSNMTSTFSPVPPEISNGTYSPNTAPGYYNHSLEDWSDYTCRACHVYGSVERVTEFMHNVAEGVEGGPNCISCHGLGGSASYRVNVSAMNSTDSIHAGLNADAVNSTNVPADNKICWGCHSTDGTEPSAHPDKKSNPWNCIDCHTGAGKYNASIASEHYYNGTDIKTNPSLSSDRSCTSCHHKGEMLIPANDTDTGTFDK